MSVPSTVQLKYSVVDCSEHSGRYVADNIRFDKPYDPTSRWSSAKDNAVNGRSWVLIELEEVAVLESITFGKYHKIHPCNMKEFEIHIGMSRDHLREVLRSSLKNDSKPENFQLPSKREDGMIMPTRFVKIVTLSAHGHSYNTSIWYVSLAGISDEKYVREVQESYEEDRETAIMRYILKHLRQRRHISTYRQILSRSPLRFEHPLVSELYNILVLRGDWAAAEVQLRLLADANLFHDYVHSCTPHARWSRLNGVDANGDAPSPRGGHAMCLDPSAGLIYLFGGYDGQKSLDDFWVYNIRDHRWRLIHHAAEDENVNETWPSPRSCHKMVFDPKSGCIYMLGRLADGDLPNGGNGVTVTPGGSTPNTNNGVDSTGPSEPQQQSRIQSAWRTTAPRPTEESPAQPNTGQSPPQTYISEFYRYRTRGIDQGKWELLNFDTAEAGGPQLCYDLQLALDSEAQVLYVQGGRIVDGDWSTQKHSGFYSYDLRTGKWTNIQVNPQENTFPPRYGQATVFNPRQRKLFIIGGQKDEYLSDMWEYDVQSRMLTMLFPNITAVGGPEACFAQRAVIDPGLKEIYVFAGISKRNVNNPTGAGGGFPVSLYRCDTRPGTWVRIPRANTRGSSIGPPSPGSQSKRMSPGGKRQRNGFEGEAEEGKDEEDNEPIPRCACQVLYDGTTKTFYLHGGNAGFTSAKSGDVEERLNDFWSMKLERPSNDEVIRRATFEIRQQQFRELCEDVTSPPIKALAFLQNEVSSVVMHDDPEEAMTFRSLLSYLFARPMSNPEQQQKCTEPVTRPKGAEMALSQPPSCPSKTQSIKILSPAPAVAKTSSGSCSSSFSSESTGSRPGSAESGSGEWTCEFPADQDVPMFHEGSGQTEDDPYELELRRGAPLPRDRFKQRTDVFENLLKYINRADTQPQNDLLGLLGDS